VAIVTINTDVLTSPGNIAYVDRCDRRIKQGYRAALEALSIPLPDHIERKPTGRKPGQAIAAAFAADEAIHGDRTFTASGNRRNGDKVQPCSQPAATAKPTNPPAFLFEQVFGRNNGRS
jgi:hypothetical protein